MHINRFAVHYGLGSAPAKSNKLRVAKYWVEVLQQPRFRLGIWKQRKEWDSVLVFLQNFYMQIKLF